MLSCRTALPMLTGAGDLGGRSLAGPTFGLRCVHLWQGRRGFVGLQPCLHVPDQEPWPSAPRQINCWGEVLGPKIKGVTHTSGIGADGLGQCGEIDSVLCIHTGIIARRNRQYFFIKRVYLGFIGGFILTPRLAVVSVRLCVHVYYGAHGNLIPIFLRGCAHRAPPTKIREWVRLGWRCGGGRGD